MRTGISPWPPPLLSLLPLCSSTISPSPKPFLSFSLHSPNPKFRSPPFRISATPETLGGAVEASRAMEGADATGTSLSAAAESYKIVVRNKFGENLVGILQDVGSSDLVILCHGFRSSKESKTIACLADALTNEKISVFYFDFSGNGDSEGSFQYGNYWKEVEDLRSIVHYFNALERKIYAIVGHSKGGDVVLLYASMYHDIYTVVNISGRFDLKRGIKSRLGNDYMQRIEKDGYIDVMDEKGRFMYRVTKESLMDRLSTDMRTACLSIDKSCRVLTIHGSEDDIVPLEDALEFAKCIANHKLHVIEGADHRFLSHQFQLARTLLEFIGPHLLGGSLP